MVRRLLIAFVFFPLPAAPPMSFRVVDPWPNPDLVSGVQQETVTFQNTDPFVPADIARTPARMVRGLLFLPPGASSFHSSQR